tara:strand:- start:61 stop:1116 length:1056 start_codon:yes stop_codon:yes gene_type:complete
MAIDPLSATIGIASTVLGFASNKSSQNAANARYNQQAKAQYDYDMEGYDMRVEKAQADWDEIVRGIETKQANEIKLAKYKDANALDSYNYGMQIRNKQQESLNNQFKKSQELYKSQVAFNELGAGLAKQSQQRALRETTQKLIFQNQDAILKQLSAEGKARVTGGSGRSAGKVVQATLASLGRTQSALAESLMSAQYNTRSANLNIDLKKEIADKNAYANLMLDPGTLPIAPKPYKTLVSDYELPRELEDFDFGPEPIKYATATYTTPWTNLAAGVLDSLAGASGGAPSQNLTNFKYSDFSLPNSVSQDMFTYNPSSNLTSSFGSSIYSSNFSGFGSSAYADLGANLNITY